jgi:hypothetical protein
MTHSPWQTASYIAALVTHTDSYSPESYLCYLLPTLVVTAKTATPTKVDSKLSDAHSESLKRREGEGECH